MLRFWHRNVFIIWQFLRNIMCSFLKQIYRSKNQYFLLILITHDQENNILIGSHDVLAQNHVRKITLDHGNPVDQPVDMKRRATSLVTRLSILLIGVRVASSMRSQKSNTSLVMTVQILQRDDRLKKWRGKDNMKNKKRRILTKRSRTKTEWTKQGEDRVNKKCVTSRKTGN